MNKLVLILSVLFLSSPSYSSELITITPAMKDHILSSNLKVELKNNNKSFIAYLYAENEITMPPIEHYSCYKGEGKIYSYKKGTFYIYLFDTEHNNFLPYRTKIFEEFDFNLLNEYGTDLIVLSGKGYIADVLIISQFGTCAGNFYEAYGFSRDNNSLINYKFSGEIESTQFYGIVSEIKRGFKVNAYQYCPSEQESCLDNLIFSVPNVFGQVNVETNP